MANGPLISEKAEIQIPDKTEVLHSHNSFFVRTLAARKSYFQPKARYATQDVTTGAMWEQKIQETMQKTQITDRQTATEILQRIMQGEAWPHGLVTIDQLPPGKRRSLMAMSPFADPVDLLIKGGGRLDSSDLDFGQSIPLLFRIRY